jgi:hypothetical protein
MDRAGFSLGSDAIAGRLADTRESYLAPTHTARRSRRGSVPGRESDPARCAGGLQSASGQCPVCSTSGVATGRRFNQQLIDKFGVPERT